MCVCMYVCVFRLGVRVRVKRECCTQLYPVFPVCPFYSAISRFSCFVFGLRVVIVQTQAPDTRHQTSDTLICFPRCGHPHHTQDDDSFRSPVTTVALSQQQSPSSVLGASPVVHAPV
jgi:hypothetical protein